MELKCHVWVHGVLLIVMAYEQNMTEHFLLLTA